MDEGMMD